mgnify:CR=1 FL=1
MSLDAALGESISFTVVSSEGSDEAVLARVQHGVERWERKWNLAQGEQVPPVLYHYTDAAGFLGIVESQEL